jgi:hypothetical protein
MILIKESKFMAATLQQLRVHISDLPLTPSDSARKSWIFSDLLAQKDDKFILDLSKKRPLIAAQYRIHCAQIISMFNRGLIKTDAFMQAVESALVIAELLECVYHQQDETDDVNKLIRDKAIFHTFLAERYPEFNTPKAPAPYTGISQQIRQEINGLIQPRLLVIRIRRTILAGLGLKQLAMYRPWIEPIERITNPGFLYFNWLFFIPRLFVNLSGMAKHGIPNPWMSREERQVPWYLRLHFYLSTHRRYFELANDVGWCMTGVSLCFLLTGIFLPIRAYFSITMQFIELSINTIRSAVEINRLLILKKDYMTLTTNGTIPVDNHYMNALNERIAHEKRIIFLLLTNSILLAVAILTILPALVSLSPLFPLIGGLLSMMVSFRFMACDAANAKQRPLDDVTVLNRHLPINKPQPILNRTPLFFKPVPKVSPEPSQMPMEANTPSTHSGRFL